MAVSPREERSFSMDGSENGVRMARRETDRTERDSSVRIEIVAIFIILVLAILNAVRILI